MKKLSLIAVLFGCCQFLFAQANPERSVEEIFRVVEDMPRFPGCEEIEDKNEKQKCARDKMLKFVYKNLTYPKIAFEKKTEGQVVIQFIVNKEGGIERSKVIRSIGDGCDEEALRVVDMMNHMDEAWISGRQRGRPVLVQYTLPIRFKIMDDTKVSDSSPVEKQSDKKKFVIPVEMPRFPGCEEVDDLEEKEKCAKEKMLKFIYKNLRYPKEAREKKIQGQVVAQFKVEKNGTISSGKVLRDLEGGCGEEVLRIIESMNEMDEKWTPGISPEGGPMDVMYTIPIRFRLATKDEIKTIQSQKNKQEEVFKQVDEMPRFPGCENKNMTAEERKQCSLMELLQFLYASLEYPKEAQKNDIEGQVISQFVVSKDGTTSDFKIIRGIGGGCDEEVIRVLNKMNEKGILWKPGMQEGKPVNVIFTLPVSFKLSDDDEGFFQKDEVDEKPVMVDCYQIKNVKKRMQCSEEKFAIKLYRNLRYPAEARKKGIGGEVMVQFMVNLHGGMEDIKILNDIGGGCAEEVLRVLNAFQEENKHPWIPAKKDGDTVKYLYETGVKFRLE